MNKFSLNLAAMKSDCTRCRWWRVEKEVQRKSKWLLEMDTAALSLWEQINALTIVSLTVYIYIFTALYHILFASTLQPSTTHCWASDMKLNITKNWFLSEIHSSVSLMSILFLSCYIITEPYAHSITEISSSSTCSKPFGNLQADQHFHPSLSYF